MAQNTYTNRKWPNYHKREECPEFLSLALKFKLLSYFNFIGFRFHHFPSVVMKVLADHLRYISLHKCQQLLFTSYIDVFVEIYELDFRDHLLTVLPKVLDAAHELRFNFFRLWNKEFALMGRKYIQRSLLENVKRFLVLVKYGHEDQRYSGAYYLFDIFIQISDLYNLFGFRRRIVRRRSNKKYYRPIQVVYLYILAYYDEPNHGQELYEEALRVLWSSIPDPYLTKKQFLSTFGQSDRFLEFMTVWEWYAKIVLSDVQLEKSPRSLKHLAKCSIRRVLTESVQIPFGIRNLDIPVSLKSYLSLKDEFSDQSEDYCCERSDF